MMTLLSLLDDLKIHMVVRGIICHTSNATFLNIQSITQNQIRLLNDIRYKNSLRFHISLEK